jgi:hypothetical protein
MCKIIGYEFGNMVRALSDRVGASELAISIGITPERLREISLGWAPPFDDDTARRISNTFALDPGPMLRLAEDARVALCGYDYGEARALRRHYGIA